MNEEFELLRKTLLQQVEETIVARGDDAPNLDRLFAYRAALLNTTGNTEQTDAQTAQFASLANEILLQVESLQPNNRGTFTNLSGRVGKARESQLLAPANPNRVMLIIQNRSLNPLFIEFGAPATTTMSLGIDMGESFKLDMVIDTREINITSSVSNTPYVAIEISA